MADSPIVCAVGLALPPHYADQETLVRALERLWERQHYNVDRLAELHRAVQVRGRYLALPIHAYEGLTGFAARNQAWLQVGTEVGERALREALANAALTAREVDHVFFTTVTGIATPTLDARLVNRLGMRPDVKRTPLFGLGCVGGASGLARAADYLRGHPDQTAVVLAVELCSLTLQRDDLSIPNIIASGLFGDGAAAVVLAGAERAASGPRVIDSRATFYPDTERVMGWDIVEGGFKVVLSAEVPRLVRARLPSDVGAFLAEHGLTVRDLKHVIAHTGGPKVLDAFAGALDLAPEALRLSWRSLAEVGNLSSASVLFVLGDQLREGGARPGDWGLLAAMGPGFCSEQVLLRW
jgi:alkylresorcinol/alkylpyrone synthase